MRERDLMVMAMARMMRVPVIMSVMFMMVMLVMRTIVVGARRRPAIGELKPAGGDPAAEAFRQRWLAAAGRQDRGQIGKDARPQIGKRIEQRGREHVAGNAAHRVQMNVTAFSHGRKPSRACSRCRPPDML
jgi:hypothetical protein